MRAKLKQYQKWTIHYYYLTISITHLNYRKIRMKRFDENGNGSIENVKLIHIVLYVITYSQQKRLTTVPHYMGIKSPTIAQHIQHTICIFVIVHLIWRTYGKWRDHGMGGFKHINPCIVFRFQVKSSPVVYAHTALVLNWFFRNCWKNYFDSSDSKGQLFDLLCLPWYFALRKRLPIPHLQYSMDFRCR